jgi:hypothetical protein
MRTVTSISDKKFLGSYIRDQKRQPKFERTFFLGVASTVLVPQLIFCFFFGSIFALVFLACALSGGVLGKNYRRSASPIIELRLATVAQDQERSDTDLQKAA